LPIVGTVAAGGILAGVKGTLSLIKTHTQLREKVDGHETRIEMMEGTLGTVSRDTRQTAIDVAEIKGALSK
jgi:hypothetical protein